MITATIGIWAVVATIACVLLYLDGREWEKLTIDWMNTSNGWQEQSQKWEELAGAMQKIIESAGEPMTGNAGMAEGERDREAS